ncbi:MAG TPA: sigma-54 dependent transcriptional regulator [Ignavibacteriaceae bacterium]|nr:sigma-54 dependent transcriptional regulator [Ignavibacteriaceae bacterium]
MPKNKILVIDDDASTRESLEIFLTQIGFSVFLASNGKEGLNYFIAHDPDIVLTDIKMPELNGIELLKKIKTINPKSLIIMITAVGEMDSIILAMQLGAYDYIEKPIDIDNLKTTIDRAMETSALSCKLEDVTNYFPIDGSEANILVGKSKQIKEILKKVGQITSSRVNVLIQGESGTGKELIGRIIHSSGVTKGEPFVAVNSAAITETLLESEFFGHVKGSFTGAIRDKKGKFELAGHGTIFLDEIADIKPDLQVKLLRVIQEREFERVGGETTIPMNARIIVATNEDLEKRVKEGKFREDLYYRLKIFEITVPPLRERKSDIPLLVVHLITKINKYLNKKVNKIPYEVIELLQNHEWQGNVRELENTLMQGIVLAKGEVLEKQNLYLDKPIELKMKEYSENLSLEDVDKLHIKYVLDKVNWNKQKASKLLKISKQTLYNKIKNLKIFPS